jgi:hypothetical protein
MRCKDKFVKSDLEERKETQAKYVDKSAIGETQSIPVLEETDLDVMRFSLGEIPPMSEIVLVCTFYLQLELEDLSWLLHIPAKIIPKHLGDSLKCIDIANGLNEESKIQKSDKEAGVLIEEIKEDHKAYFQKQEFTCSLNFEINSCSALENIVSTTHKIDINFVDEDIHKAQINLVDQPEGSLFDSDFKLLFRNSDTNKPIVLAQKLDDEYAVMVSFLADVTPEGLIEHRIKNLQDSVDMD